MLCMPFLDRRLSVRGYQMPCGVDAESRDCTGSAARALRSLRTCWTLGSCLTGWACASGVALRSLRSTWSGRACRPLHTLRALRSLNTLSASRYREVKLSIRSRTGVCDGCRRPGVSGRDGAYRYGSCGSGGSLRSLRALRPLRTCRSLGSCRACRSGIALSSLRSVRSASSYGVKRIRACSVRVIQDKLGPQVLSGTHGWNRRIPCTRRSRCRAGAYLVGRCYGVYAVAGCSRVPLFTLRTCSSCFSLSALRALRAGRADGALCALLAFLALNPLCTLRYSEIERGCGCRARIGHGCTGTCCSCRHRSYRYGCSRSFLALNALRALRSCRSSRACRADVSLRSLLTGRPLRPGRAYRALSALRSGISFRSLSAFIALRDREIENREISIGA